MHPGKKAYRISVSTPEGRAYLICVSYPLDQAESEYGLDFYELVWSTTLPSQTIPSLAQATFKEELRAMHRASKARTDSSEPEEQFIEKMMCDAYGNDANVSLSIIDESMQSGEL